MAKRGCWVLAAILISTPVSAGFTPDFGSVMKELELVSKTEDHITLVIWMPVEFWRAQFQAQGSLTPKAIDQFTHALDPYAMIAVIDGQLEFGGAITFSDEDLLRKSVSIEDPSGNRLEPLSPESVSGTVGNIVQMMRPAFANVLGPMGAHLEIFMFPSAGKDGKRVADATKDGWFIVHVGTGSFRYRLPLGSLMPPMIDSKTGETFPGNYHFNPFTGYKLSPTPEK